MTHEGASHAADARSDDEHQAGGPARRRWLLIARVAWGAMTGLTLGIFLAGLPARFALSNTVCSAATCTTTDQITLAAVRHLHALGLSRAFFAGYVVGLQSVTVFVFVAVALVIFWRASANRVALVAAFTFVTFPITITRAAHTLPTPWVLPAQVVDVLGSSGMTLLLCVFPNGRFVPRWTRWLWAANQLLYTAKVFFPSAFTSQIAGGLPLLGLVACLGAVQVYRYRRVSTPVECQQTKWVVLGVAGGFVVFILIVATFLLVPDLASRNSLLYLIAPALVFLSLMLIPLAFGVAILRFRLWDIDTLINKVLIYGLLTGLLAALYVGLILGLEHLAGAVSGQAEQPVVIVVSTLAIATLFTPLRRRLQGLIDRRFYRQKYDAAKSLAAFSATLRREVDLTQIHVQLLAVIQETMQPASLSLWLFPIKPKAAEGETRIEARSAAGTPSTTDRLDAR